MMAQRSKIHSKIWCMKLAREVLSASAESGQGGDVMRVTLARHVLGRVLPPRHILAQSGFENGAWDCILIYQALCQAAW